LEFSNRRTFCSSFPALFRVLTPDVSTHRPSHLFVVDRFIAALNASAACEPWHKQDRCYLGALHVISQHLIAAFGFSLVTISDSYSAIFLLLSPRIDKPQRIKEKQ
jgi:hypothetical protein